MSETISIPGAVIAILLPWIMGSAWIYWLLGRTSRWNLWLVIGHGYLFGLFVTTGVIRAWSLTGLPLSFAGIASCLSAIALAGAVLAWRQPAQSNRGMSRASLPLWEVLFCAVILALLLWRYSTMLQEVVLRPLFPWDAWMNWAPKAIVWFHYKELVPYVSPETWLNAPADALNYTLGAYKAWKYPDGVPLVMLWGMLAVGSSDSTLPNLPWIFISISLGLTLYGHLRLSAIPAYLALSAVYLLLSMPFLNVHSALAGYADLWVAATFGCAVFAVAEWDNSRRWPYAVLAIYCALFCAELKIPGLVMAMIAMGFLLLSLPNIRKQYLIALACLGGLAVIAVFLVGLDVTIPGLGRIALGTSQIAVPYIGEFQIAWHSITPAMLNTFFLMINWNILWYLVAVLFVFVIVKPRLLVENFVIFGALACTLIFLLFVYYFTGRYKFALDYTQVNRAMIYLTPICAYALAVTVATRWRSSR